MSSYPEHPLSYRQEIAAPIFRNILSGESCVVIGAASMAKSNLVKFIQRPDVQAYYLGDLAAHTLLVLVDTNRLAEVEFSDWVAYELILNSLVEASYTAPQALRLPQMLGDLHRDLTLHRDRLLAQRYLERAIRLICTENSLRLAIIIDDADPLYQAVSASFLNNLRALRDMYKYHLCYILFTRQPLEDIGNSPKSESFYELFNRNVLGLKPYQPVDAMRVIEQQEIRKQFHLTAAQRAWLVSFSGGHSGILVAAFDLLAKGWRIDETQPEKWLREPTLNEECQKLWKSLNTDEHWMLVRLQAGLEGENPEEHPILQALIHKGLICQDQEDHWRIFSPLFDRYVQLAGQDAADDFHLDEVTASVWVAGRQTAPLTQLEYRLIKVLYQNRGQVLGRDLLLQALYPKEFSQSNPTFNPQDNRVDNLIRRLRNKIESNPGQPRYILTRRGHGYLLKPASGEEEE